MTREYHKEYYHRHADRIRAQQRGYTNRLRMEVIDAYGGKCACCGEDNPLFLDLDHVNGGGSSKRRRQKSPYTDYRDARRHGFPPDYQVLCCNCNCGRQRNGGICPHKEIRSKAA